MKILLQISLVLVGFVFLTELAWIGKSDLAVVIMGLAIAIGLQAIYLIKKDKD